MALRIGYLECGSHGCLVLRIFYSTFTWLFGSKLHLELGNMIM